MTAADSSTLSRGYPTLSYEDVRAELLARREILLADVREEDPFAQGHPLWAANFPLGRLELDAWRRIPRRDTLIVLYGRDGDTDLAPLAADRLRALGYGRVHLLAGGLEAWKQAGGELFIDVNVPSKAFGELVEARRHTPLLEAGVVKELIDSGANVAVLDARRFDEYRTMSIPTGISVPGAELVLRVGEIAPDPDTLVIVNCAGRTRSIIGTQSLINAGIPNRVAGLRNGTIGWTLAGYDLDHGASRRFLEVGDAHRDKARRAARQVAERAGVRRIPVEAIEALQAQTATAYFFDVRTGEEYAEGHLPGFAHVPGGQLVQETDHYAPVRGARIVLSDDDGTRADMSASWLAQMGWDVAVVEPVEAGRRSAAGIDRAAIPQAPESPTIAARALSDLLAQPDSGVVVLDFAASARYVAGHVPGAWFALRARLPLALTAAGPARRYVVTCGDGNLAAFAAADLAALTDAPVFLLEGGNAAWIEAGLPVQTGETRLAAPRVDRYRRPYEGTDAPAEAMQAYLEWEYGLVAQLDRDGTHFFRVI